MTRPDDGETPEAPRPRRALPVVTSPAPGGEGCAGDEGLEVDAADLVDAAYEAEDPAEQAALARQALELDPDAVDALLLLAGQAPTLEDALAAHAAARAAAERVLGLAPGADLPPGADADGPDERAWLRALAAEAELLAAADRTAEAAAALGRVVAHDPGDSLEAASLLVACRLRLGEAAAVRALLGEPRAKGRRRADEGEEAEEAPPEAAWRAWTQVLLAQSGATAPDPARADPARADPAQADPAQADPAQADPAQADPAQADPAKVGPAKVGPAKAGPAKAGPAKAGPAKAGQAKGPRAKGDPAKGPPAKAGQAKGSPARSAEVTAPAAPPSARELLVAALGANPHVPAYLLGRRRLPRDLSARVVPGEPLEAARYVLEHGRAGGGGARAWGAGARAWLAAELPAALLEAAPAPRVPPGLRDRLRGRPQAKDEVWQLGARRLPRWVEEAGGARTRQWLTVVLGPGAPGGPGDAVLGVAASVEPPSPATLADTLLTAMRRPREGAERRPARVEVESPELAAALERPCAALGVACVARRPLQPFTAVVDRKARAMLPAAPEPGLVAGGADPGRVAAFAAAAAGAYRAAPWATFGDDELLVLEVDGAPRFAVVLGAAGELFGLAVARGEAGLRAVRELGDETVVPGDGAGCAVLLYDEPDRLALHDLEALEPLGPDVAAGDDAWPRVVALAGGRVAAPTPADLDDLEAVARALGAGLEPGAMAQVQVGGRTVTVRLIELRAP